MWNIFQFYSILQIRNNNNLEYSNRMCHARYTFLYTNHKCMNKHKLPFSARILEFGFMRAESAVMGLLKGWFGMLMSMITMLFCGEVSLTQIYLSDSIVTCVNVMNCGLIPMLGSCDKHQITKSRSFNY